MNSKKKTSPSNNPSPSEVSKTPPADADGSQPNTERHQQGRLIAVSAEYRGPLPPPQMLAEYDQILPGAADRIISIWEREAVHRHGMQTEGQALLGREVNRGQLFTFITSLVILGVGGYIAIAGNNITGFGLMVFYLAGLAGLYVYGKERNISLQKNDEVIEIESEPESSSDE